MKKLLSFLLTAALLLTCTVPAYAFPGFTESGGETVEGFAEEYGWDTDAINADTWDGKPDSTIMEQRQLEEAYATTPEQLDEIARRYGNTGLSPVVEQYGRSTGHQKEAFEDQLEADELMAYEFGLISSVGSSGNGAQKIIEVALGELGHNNATENRYGSATGMGYNAAWCCSFVSWCAKECGFVETGLYAATASCINMSNYMINTNGFQRYYFEEIVQFGGSGYSVVPGDLYFFSTGSGSSHIALIAEVTQDSFTTIEGLNQGNVPSGQASQGRVAQRTFSASQLYSAYETQNGWVIHVEYPNTYGDLSFTDADLSTNEGRRDAIFAFVTQVWGMSPAAACGVLGNLYVEAWDYRTGDYWSPNAIGDNGNSHGIVQWNNAWGEWDKCVNWCDANGYDCWSLEGQLYYMMYYVDTNNERRQVSEKMRTLPNTQDTAYTIAYEWCIHCEKPADMYNSGAKRGGYAKYMFWPIYGSY